MLEQINYNQTLDDIFNLVEWDLDYHAKITKPNGEIVYEQLHTEFPKSWSENARNIVASKYFYGKGKNREYSLKQFITRIVKTIAIEGRRNNYITTKQEYHSFRNKLAYILLTQRAFFNTPVNFSIGIEGKRPVASACYLLAVEDNLDSILENAKTEGLVFKDGSGCGINLSSLRGANEYIGDSNGTSSGPMSFDKIYDTVAKITKSGGSCLGPDQLIFTDDGLKTVKELESLNKDFIVMSYDPLLHRFKAKIGRAYKNGKKMVYLLKTDKGEFQLTNDHYVMLAHGSYEKVENLLPNMSLMQMSSDITKQGYLRIGLKNGKKTKKSFHRLIGEDLLNATSKDNVHHKDENKLNNKLSNLEVLTQGNHSLLHCNELVEKNEHVFQKRKFPKNGINNGMHKNSSFWSNENKVSSYKEKQSLILSSSDRPKEMQKLSSKQRMINFGYKLINIGADISTFDLYFKNRKLLWNGKQGNSKEKALNLIIKYFGTYDNYYKTLRENNHKVISITPLNIMDVYDIEVDCESLDDKSVNSGHNFVIFGLNTLSPVGKGLVVSNSRRAARMVVLNDNHPDIEEFITCKAKEEEKAKALIKAGYDSAPGGEAYLSVAYQNANYTVRVSDSFLEAVKNDADWDLINVKDKEVFKTIKAKELWNLICKSAWESGDPGIQFDSTIQNWHTLPNIGRINTSNPCSEFLHLDFSSCNLASINLLKFYDKENNHFNTEDYITTIELFTIAMNILLDFVVFPTEKITEVTKKCRPIGLGFANLGGLLMSMGIPYDSDNGRAIASALMSAITGFAYKASAKLSQKLNREFDYLKTNRKEMLDVISTHKAHMYKIKNIDLWVEKLVNQTINAFNYSISAKSFMNSQVTVLAPTGTTGIAMDCDTTGCEPELALVRYKWLVGGGTQTFTNSCIESALTNLRYSKDDIKNIIQYIYENGNIENCKLLKSEHLNIFDTSFKNRNGNRFIEPRGHVRMLGALAPFISGSASKTVNLPESATIEDISDIYMMAHELGVKCVAVYRDNCKASQPMSTEIKEGNKGLNQESNQVNKESISSNMSQDIYPNGKNFWNPNNTSLSKTSGTRSKLNNTRRSITHKFDIDNHEFYVTVGLYDDGTPGELFITASKEGSFVRGIMDSFATIISIALQYGVPLSVIIDKLKGSSFEPSGYTNNTDIKTAKSVVDYLAKYLQSTFIDNSFVNGINFNENVLGNFTTANQFSEPISSNNLNNSTGDVCSFCGNLLVLVNKCKRCLTCGEGGGCGE